MNQGRMNVYEFAKQIGVSWPKAYDLLVAETDENGIVTQWTELATSMDASQNVFTGRITIDAALFIDRMAGIFKQNKKQSEEKN